MSHVTNTSRPAHNPGGITDAPAYFIAEAAHYLNLPSRTVRDWVCGRDYPTDAGQVRSAPLVKPADPEQSLLSFLNLVELHVIGSIRRVHRVKPRALRKAIDYLEKTFHSKHPLLNQKMLTDGKGLFIERYGNLVDISDDGQMRLREALEAYLQRVEWDENHIPIRLFPFTRTAYENAPQLVVIDPRIRSGQPCIVGTRVPTSIIAERHKSGDSVSDLAADYGRTPEEIEEALRYESRAAS
jgi:uncharacterized protein (DUF433 family)